jgi:hypothetical protein
MSERMHSRTKAKPKTVHDGAVGEDELYYE